MAANVFTDIDDCADWIIETVGPDLRLALPLGLGKANGLANAIYRRALSDRNLRLHIITGLTPEPPRARSELERRFLEPLTKRLFGDYPQLLYAADRRAGRLPGNVEVFEFYMSPGSLLDNAHAQQHYISSNYTNVARDLAERDVNVIAQLVTHRTFDDGRRRFSLSCNPDLTLDVAGRQRASGRPILVVGEVNDRLPFMYGDAVVDAGFFDAVVETGKPGFKLFSTPKAAVDTVDHMIGLHASTLVRDGGTLQVGIGSLGDAVVSALEMRHEHNPVYRSVLTRCGLPDRFQAPISRVGGLDTFGEGLYGATEMLVDGFLHLFRAGILSRRVYKDAAIQRLLNSGHPDDSISISMLTGLADGGAIHDVLTRDDVEYLKRWGIFRPAVFFDGSDLVTPGGGRLLPDLDDKRFLDQVVAECLGEKLTGGVVVSAGFFLGPEDFYAALRDMPEEERALIDMTGVSNINQLYRDVDLYSLQRKDARFINSCLMATLTGAVVSDGLENQRVLSGVGGQFDFVTMAHALPGGRSIITLRSTRESGGRVTSNIRFSYGYDTVPRHLRDFVISEYGIADLRGKSDAETTAAMLNIADSRFQRKLLDRAIRAGKLPRGYRIPDAFRNNFPGTLEAKLAHARSEGWFNAYPFGSELTDVERTLAGALKRLSRRGTSTLGKAQALMAAVRARPDRYPEPLARLALSAPANWREMLYARLVAGELARDA